MAMWLERSRLTDLRPPASDNPEGNWVQKASVNSTSISCRWEWKSKSTSHLIRILNTQWRTTPRAPTPILHALQWRSGEGELASMRCWCWCVSRRTFWPMEDKAFEGCRPWFGPQPHLFSHRHGVHHPQACQRLLRPHPPLRDWLAGHLGQPYAEAFKHMWCKRKKKQTKEKKRVE